MLLFISIKTPKTLLIVEVISTNFGWFAKASLR
ncbi:hypothetical protein A0J61_09084 [Choanephora cucurbitarum]|uniref:Uncharacterized protein n=1 Tax=Choanephora cucurbitarum TaxID=101091 RepID=A0A1C7N1A8_9FUNG|nr:hypothetical protein A0J61_09084 [Choanephora cucurbitarum]